jgi:hypothetical protein
MLRSLSTTLTAFLLLGVVASTASACINDREIDSQERFFKSSYIEKPTPEPASPPAPADDKLMVWGGIGAGAALLLAAFASMALGITVPRRN